MATDKTADERLARAAADGDTAAFQELVRRYRQEIYGFLARQTRSTVDAEDLTQETFLRVFRYLPSFNPERPFRPWLYRIAANQARTFWKRRSRQETLVESKPGDEDWTGHLPDPHPKSDPEARVLDAEGAAIIEAALASLPEKYRELLVLKHVQGLGYQELCDLLGLPLTIVKNRLYRGRQMLRDALAASRASPLLEGALLQRTRLHDGLSGGERR